MEPKLKFVIMKVKFKIKYSIIVGMVRIWEDRELGGMIALKTTVILMDLLARFYKDDVRIEQCKWSYSLLKE